MAAAPPPAKRTKLKADTSAGGLGGCLGGDLPLEVEKRIFSSLSLKDRVTLSKASKQCQQNTFEEDGTWNALVNHAGRLANEESRRALWFIWSNWPRQKRTIENKTTGTQTIITPSVADAASELFLGEANPPVRTEKDLIAFITAELLLDEAFLVEAVGEDWKIDVAMWTSQSKNYDEYALAKRGHYTLGVDYDNKTTGGGKTKMVQYVLDHRTISPPGRDRFPSVAIVHAVMGDNWRKLEEATAPEDVTKDFLTIGSMLFFANSSTTVLPLALRVANPMPRTEAELGAENKDTSQNIKHIWLNDCAELAERYGERLNQRDVAIGLRMPHGIGGMYKVVEMNDGVWRRSFRHMGELRKHHLYAAALAQTVAPTARLGGDPPEAPLRLRGRGGAAIGIGTGARTGSVLVRRRPPPPPAVEGRAVGSLPGARRGRNLVREYATRK
jgi:hypothetical protein